MDQMKDIIVKLIKADIKQTCFINGLNKLGLSADEQLLDLSPIIFDLMRLDRSTVERSDMIIDQYLKLLTEYKIDRNENLIYLFINLFGKTID